MSKHWPKGSTRAWRKIRARVLLLNAMHQGGVCQLAIRGTCTGRPTQVHHTRPRADVGDDPTYLIAVCRECNLKVGEPGTTSPKPRKVSRW